MSEAFQWVTLLMPLPNFYNPDAEGVRKPVEEEKFQATAKELTEHFRGGAVLYGEPKGFWWDRGYISDDVLVLLEADIPDTRQSREWLRNYARTVLLERFDQKAIYWKLVRPIERALITVEGVSPGAGE